MKNWNNLSDDELDELFRQSAEKKQIEFDESAWDKMNHLLDSVPETSKTNKWLKRSAVLALLLFLGSVGLYLGLQQYNKNNKGTQITVGSENVDPNNKAAKNGSVINDINKDRLANTSGERPENKENESNLKETVPDKIRAEKLSENYGTSLKFNKNESEPIANKNNQTEKFIIKNKGDKITLKHSFTAFNGQNLHKKDRPRHSEINSLDPEKKTIDSQKIEKSPLQSRDLSITKTKKSVDFNENNLAEKQKEQNSQFNQGVDQAPESTAEAGLKNTILVENLSPNLSYHQYNPIFFVEVMAPILPKIQPKPEDHFKKGLSIRLAYSPDISVVGKNGISKIGSNWGALLEYRVCQNILIQSGVIRSIKYYDAYPEQYDWVWGKPASKLMEINAVCNMLDIPLNIRYDITRNTKSRIFASTGLTSYWMMKEKYHYDYEDNANPNIKRHDWSGKTGMYKSSNLNLSVGFEKQVAPSLTFQVEPFAKSPLKSIGFGKVPLITYGLLFSANYHFKNVFKK